MCLKWRVYMPLGEGERGRAFVSEDVPLVDFMYLAFTRMAGESYVVGDSGLCCVRVTSVEH